MEDLGTVLLFVGVLVVSVIVHEVAHGVAADRLGDSTAREAGRLTLNPLRHVDPFGSIVLPLVTSLAGVPFGFAKPVPVRPSRLRSPRRDMVLVSLAGPGSNFVLCAIGAVIAKVAFLGGAADDFDGLPLGVRIALSFAFVNLVLGVFNLLPIPPLDGSAVVGSLLPARFLRTWSRFGRYGFFLVFALAATGSLSFVFDPALDLLVDFLS